MAYNVSLPPLYHKEYPAANRQYVTWYDTLGNMLYNNPDKSQKDKEAMREVLKLYCTLATIKKIA